MSRTILAVLCAISLSALSPQAQTPDPLVGTWERFSATDGQGLTLEPQPPAAVLVFTASGYFSEIAMPAKRPSGGKSLEDMSQEELLARMQNTEGRRGTYTLEGDRLTRRNVVPATSPGLAAADAAETARVDSDVLILGSTDPNNKAESRFRRVR